MRQRSSGAMLALVLAGTERGRSSFAAFVTGTFVFGWVVGLVAVLKLWQLAHAPRWMMWSGAGYVSLMLVPAATGFVVTRLARRLVARGWGGTPLRMAAVGVCGLLAGLLAL